MRSISSLMVSRMLGRKVGTGGSSGYDYLRATADKHRLTVAVTDTGDGIAAEHLPHVFERFYRVDAARDREHGGAGIGLAIARALVDAHGGDITASSRGAGTGTTFTITLPVDQT